MKTQRTLVVISLVLGLGPAACQGKLDTGLADLSDAGQGGSSTLGGHSSAIGGAAGGAVVGTAGGATTGPVAPLDASPDGPSVSDGGCPAGIYVYYSAPGCGAEARPRCDTDSPDAICAAIVYYCACDGVTTTSGSCGGVSNTPYLYAGACKSDSGSARSYAGIFLPTGSMAVGREYHTATLLPSGKVLISGGWVHGAGDATAEVASAELYDPGTGTFTATGSMNFARDEHTATLLTNGLVLIAGGVASAEVYDPGPEPSPSLAA